MKKSFFAFVTLLLFVNLSLPVAAYTESQIQEATEIINEANADIYEEIDSALTKSDKILKKYEDGIFSEAQKDAKIQNVIDQLIKKTNHISQKVQKNCSKIGVVTQCTYIYITIDEQVVAVDPFIIVGT